MSDVPTLFGSIKEPDDDVMVWIANKCLDYGCITDTLGIINCLNLKINK